MLQKVLVFGRWTQKQSRSFSDEGKSRSSTSFIDSKGWTKEGCSGSQDRVAEITEPVIIKDDKVKRDKSINAPVKYVAINQQRQT